MKNYTIQKIMTSTLLPQEDRTVLSWSEKLSQAFEAQLVLYNAVRPMEQEDLESSGQGEKSNKRFKSALNRLLELGKSLNQAYKVRYVVEESSHWRNFLLQVRDERADLLVTKMPSVDEHTLGQASGLMYKSSCPVLFVREGMPALLPSKILVPVRLKDGLEQKLPSVINWAKTCGAAVHFSAFSADGATAREKLQLLHLVEKMSETLRHAGLQATVETAHGFHFGTAMVQRAQITGADLIAIAVEPANYMARLFNKMVGPYFLENATVPVLSIPILMPIEEKAVLQPGKTTLNLPAEMPLAVASA